MTSAQFLPSIAPIAERYDGFILDLWGVIHDGQQLYPNVRECLEALRKKDKKIIFLSNAPRRASAVAEVLLRMGITPDFYDKLITSGETAYQCLADSQSAFFKPAGNKFFYIGLEKDRNIFGDLPFVQVNNPEEADFLVLSHSFVDNQPLPEILPLLEHSKRKNLTALCLNPDMEVVRMGGQHVYCGGELAAQYKKLGGNVVYFGKPHQAVYDACLHVFSALDKSQIVAVGDNLATDILGANTNGIASVLTTGGILQEMLKSVNEKEYEKECNKIFETTDIQPLYVVPSFNW